jgi:hypothetical protein
MFLLEIKASPIRILDVLTASGSEDQINWAFVGPERQLNPIDRDLWSTGARGAMRLPWRSVTVNGLDAFPIACSS